MLVLSRNEGEGIVFPELDVAVQILRVAGTRIRVGVKAPDDIRVLRSELVDRSKSIDNNLENRPTLQALRNRLNTASLAITMAQNHLERGELVLAEEMLQRTLAGLTNSRSVASPSANLPSSHDAIATVC